MEIKDLAGLSEPLTALVKGICEGVGVAYEPTRIRRRAAAEKDARLIVAKGETEVIALLARSNARVQTRELRRQKNLEAIVDKTIPLLPASGAGSPLDEDWIAELVSSAQDVSNETMQSLWARILAGETARPRSFSRRTLQAVRVLSKEDADAFTHFCSYIWWIDGNYYHYLPDAIEEQVLTPEGLLFPQMLHLHSIGLITEPRAGGVALKLEADLVHRLQYHERYFDATIPSGVNDPEWRIVPLTVIGHELVAISGANPSPAYFEFCLKSMRDDLVGLHDVTNEPHKAAAGDARP